MFSFGDLFQWERFITPSIIKIFYGLAVVVVVLIGLSSIVQAAALIPLSPILGFITTAAAVAATIIGIVFARIAAEFVLIVFRINEHLGAIRDRGDGMA